MTVRSSFFEYPAQGGPVTVSVFSNMDEKPDWTGLPSTRRRNPVKGHFAHQKPPYPNKEHFGSQTLTPKLPNQNQNTKTLRKDPAEQGHTLAAAHPNPNE